MPILEAEIAFKKGLVALARGNAREAADQFERAVVTERARKAPHPQMRYLSYFGLASALAARATPEAIRACEMAARTDPFNPDLELNLGKVYLLAGQRTKARAALRRGRALSPGHPGIVGELARLDREEQSGERRGLRLDQALGALRSMVSSVTHRLSPPRRDTSSP